MNYVESRTLRGKTIAFLGTASLITMANAVSAWAQTSPAQVAEAQVPEQVLITGSLIHGAVAVGSPVTALSAQDFKEAGALTTADVLKDVPSVYVIPSLTITKSRGNLLQQQNTEIHNIGGDQTAPKTLLMVDGLRTPLQGGTLCGIDPSIIPQLAMDRIDVLADGASATYGSDAIAGVINIVLKRGFDGAITQFQVGGSTDIGGLTISGSQLFGHTWDGGDITLTYEYYHIDPIIGPARSYFTFDFSPWGFDNRTPITSAAPGIVSTGAPAAPARTPAGFSATSGNTCINCYSIPKGQNGQNLTWAQITGNPGVANAFNPYAGSSVLPSNERNAFVGTFDQNIYKGDGIVQSVQFFAEGFYNNRRAVVLSAGDFGATLTNALTLSVPTANPYYPVGAPSGLRVSYSFAAAGQDQGRDAVYAGEGRYAAGFNIELPRNWEGKIEYAETQDNEGTSLTNYVNPNLASAALGNTIAASSTFGSYTKPAGVPYLNLFCDPYAFSNCNSPATLAYITATAVGQNRQNFEEMNSTFDGPLFDLPGGTVKFAIGGDYLSEHYIHTALSGASTPAGNADPTSTPDQGAFNVWAGFAQLNVPVISQQNAVPLVNGLDFEASGRIDSYSNVGETKNYRLAANWDIAFGFTVRGSVGTSFRAPNFVDLTGVVGSVIQPLNISGGAQTNTYTTCSPGQAPATGSAAAILNPTCSAALANPGGITVGGGAGLGKLIEPSSALHPEMSRNWNVGFEFAPSDFLRGLDIQATLWNIKINGAISTANVGTGLNDPLALQDGRFILNTNPNFKSYLNNVLGNSFASPLINASNILFIENNTEINTGFLLYEGVDFSASYVLDLADWGAWNTGVTGTYQLADQNQSDPGFPIADEFNGRNSGGRLAYRARLGWAGGPDDAWSFTTFLNYRSHMGSQQWGDNVRIQNLPPSCFISGPTCASFGPQFSQYSSQFPNFTLVEPAWYSIDLSLGYKTGDRPANDYLKNIGVQLTVNDLLDKRPRFAYVTSTSGGSPDAFDRTDSPLQRTITLIVTKVW